MHTCGNECLGKWYKFPPATCTDLHWVCFAFENGMYHTACMPPHMHTHACRPARAPCIEWGKAGQWSPCQFWAESPCLDTGLGAYSRRGFAARIKLLLPMYASKGGGCPSRGWGQSVWSVACAHEATQLLQASEETPAEGTSQLGQTTQGGGGACVWEVARTQSKLLCGERTSQPTRVSL